MRQCAALTNTARRVTCYDLLTQLRVTERPETTGQSEGLPTRVDPEEISKVDAWINAQPEPKPSRSEAVRRLIDLGLQPRKSSP
jgi:hypothetical protein